MTAMTSRPALSNATDVQIFAERVLGIADLVHKCVKDGPVAIEAASKSTDLYRLLTEEYGLRTRVTILRNDGAAHVVERCSTDQTNLLKILDSTAGAVARIKHIEQLRSLTAALTTLCVAISPSKAHVVDFLVRELKTEAQGIK